jgi:hypothetical protein|tara:strand:+ start:2342 stop:2500 length:159 start_codon:yes stop_codon:yes gene_type:complete
MKNKSAKKLAELLDDHIKQALQKRFKLDKNFKPIRIAAAKHYTKKAGYRVVA